MQGLICTVSLPQFFFFFLKRKTLKATHYVRVSLCREETEECNTDIMEEMCVVADINRSEILKCSLLTLQFLPVVQIQENKNEGVN